LIYHFIEKDISFFLISLIIFKRKINLMSISFIVLEKHHPSKPDEPKRFYAQAKSRGSLHLRDIAQTLSERSTLSRADVLAVLEGLIELIPEKLMEGYLLKLGDLGTFRLGFKSAGEEKAEKVGPKSISGPRINFLPSTLIKGELKKAKYEKWKA
jgi:predicted histone-like DNA-binding protein